tara:strand:+ start:144 stop:389 length:246 start_codon:yes stop_codon:yes gene_type:complete
MAYSKLDSLVYKYRDFSIYNFGSFSVKVGKDVNPQAQAAPKVVQDAFNAYHLCYLITFDELVEVCQEERDSSKKVPQSYLQ